MTTATGTTDAVPSIRRARTAGMKRARQARINYNRNQREVPRRTDHELGWEFAHRHQRVRSA